MSRECQPTGGADCVKTDATALRRGESRLGLQKEAVELSGMPRPCAVEAHARDYKKKPRNSLECHGLAPWRLTLATTRRSRGTFWDATALRRGGSRSRLQEEAAELSGMPRPCAVEAHARGYKNVSKGCGPAEAQGPVAKSIKRETPRRKAVASQGVGSCLCSRERETPRRKAVASQGVVQLSL
jgi:hypothetical protein